MRKYKKILVPIFTILIIGLIGLLVFENFFSSNAIIKKYKIYESKTNITNKLDVKNNSDIKEGKNFISDSKGNKVNIKKDIRKEFNLDGYKLSDGYLSVSSKTPEYCILSIKVEATKEMPTNYNFLVKFYDSSNKQLGIIIIAVPNMKANEKNEYIGETYSPIIDADHITIEKLVYND